MNASNETDDARIQSFVAQVRAYVELIDGAENVEPIELLRACSRMLPRLYADALELPDMETTDLEEATVESPFKRLRGLLAPVDWYWVVYDPYERPDGELVGSLADDLADIYRDLRRPLIDFDAGCVGDAVWQWRFNVMSHSGEHMLEGLHAIHWILYTHGWPRPQDPLSPANEAGQP